MTDKRYKIISNIENDAPFKNITHCTISFLTPQKIEKCKYLDVVGFKVHNGYNNEESADEDGKKIQDAKKEHDVYLSQMGKVESWDDATRADNIRYQDKKLDELEKTRKENIDKSKLMAEQFKNEYQTLHANVNKERQDKQVQRMQEKLYKQGKITKKEYELIQETEKPVMQIKEEAKVRSEMEIGMEECFKTDYLDENPPTAFTHGIISIYSPRHIKGLKITLYKIRGLFQSPADAFKHVAKLKARYPDDRIYVFEVGKWNAYSDIDDLSDLIKLKQLNYGMKCHLDNLVVEKEEFEKRKEQLQAKTEQESKMVKAQNRRERRKAQQEARKAAKKGVSLPNQNPTEASNSDKTNTSNENTSKPSDIPTSIGNPEDEAAIQSIMDYLDDPELRNKFVLDKSQMETMTLGV